MLRLSILICLLVPGMASAQQCGGDFRTWLDGVKAEALAAGASQATVAATLDGLTFDQSIVNRDRAQGVFAQSFLEFSDRMVNQYRLDKGRAEIKRQRALFDKIEAEFGVPAGVITAFWALETDFGAVMGDFPVLRSLATLGNDCRRPELFRRNLLAAVMLVERGDLQPQELVGAWAGEIGQVQFLPDDYLRNAVDYDGDGKRNLRRSVPDVLASAASLLRSHGWRAGEPWLEEVRVPAEMPWQEADLKISHPPAQFAAWGVTRADGSPLGDGPPASLILPMGKDGPAFLAYPNFQVFLQWNQSLVYATTAAYLGTRLAGAPKVGRGNAPVAALGTAEVKALQQALERQGYDVGKIDGIIGENTRAAVKDVQMKLGLPADSYPTKELLARLR
jgi:lytic murein transglycosylase